MFNRSTKEKKEKMRSEGILKIDVLDGLKQIETASQDLIIADPPYYKAINEKWDKQWKTEAEYLDWCKLWFNECVRVLKDTGSFYCYGNFDILSKQKVLIFDNQLNFRQNITLDKGLKSIAGRTSDKLRMFPTASEYILFYIKDTMPKIRLLLKQKMEARVNSILMLMLNRVLHLWLIIIWILPMLKKQCSYMLLVMLMCCAGITR